MLIKFHSFTGISFNLYLSRTLLPLKLRTFYQHHFVNITLTLSQPTVTLTSHEIAFKCQPNQAYNFTNFENTEASESLRNNFCGTKALALAGEWWSGTNNIQTKVFVLLFYFITCWFRKMERLMLPPDRIKWAETTCFWGFAACLPFKHLSLGSQTLESFCSLMFTAVLFHST